MDTRNITNTVSSNLKLDSFYNCKIKLNLPDSMSQLSAQNIKDFQSKMNRHLTGKKDNSILKKHLGNFRKGNWNGKN